MKLKNLKVYLLVILSFFLFNLSTNAIDIYIQVHFPSKFLQNASLPTNKKIIIETIWKALKDTERNHFDDTASKQKIESSVEKMKNDLDKTNVIAHETYIDTVTNTISQSMYIQYNKESPIPVFIHPDYQPEVIKIDIPTAFPDDFFKNIKGKNLKSTLKILKNYIPKNQKSILKKIINFITKKDQKNPDLFKSFIADEKITRIEDVFEDCNSKDKIKNQCLLISYGTDFYFFKFQSSM